MRPPHWAIRGYAELLDRRTRRGIANPRAVQERLLMRMVETCRHTELGAALGLEAVSSVADFKRRVPATDESLYRPLVQRVVEDNAPGIVAPERLEFLAHSSGTIKVGVDIPFTRRLIKAYKRFETRFVLHTMRELGDYGLFDSQILVTSGHPACDTLPSGVIRGFGSGIMTLLAPRFAASLVRPTRDILELTHWEEKIEATVRQALPLDIRAMTGVPTFVIPILERLLEVARESGRDAPNAKALWPNLAAYFWSGAPIGFYRDRLRELFGPGVRFCEFYSCTEGAMAYQYRDEEPGLLLDLEGCYFEFQPVDAPLESQRLSVHEIQAGVIYRVLVTTHAGFFAFPIGDLVEFVSTSPPLMRVVGRESERIDLAGERLHAATIKRELAGAAAAHGARLLNFCVGPDAASAEHPAHHWYLDFEEPPADVAAFVAAMDERLKAASETYAAARASRLRPPEATSLPPGAIVRYVLDHRQFGQGKFLNLYATREVPDKLLRHTESARGVPASSARPW